MSLIKIKKNEDENNAMIIAYIVALVIGASFLPFLLVFIFQDTIYHSLAQQSWFFLTPISSYFTFMSGMFWIVLTLFIYLIFKIKNIHINKIIITLLLSISIVFFYFGVHNYYYFNDLGFHYRYVFHLEETHYYWEDISEVQQYNKVKDGVLKPDRMVFILKDHSEITLPVDNKFKIYRSTVISKVNGMSIPLTIIEE